MNNTEQPLLVNEQSNNANESGDYSANFSQFKYLRLQCKLIYP